MRIAMWARLVVAPWWVQWLVSASAFTCVLWVVFLLAIRDFTARAGGLWSLLALVAFGLVFSALSTAARRPILRSYAPAIAGLNLAERSQAVNALRRGDIPADPRLLAAAIRIGNLSMAYQRRIPRWQRTLQWVAPALWIAAGILGFVAHDIRTGLIWVGLALLLVAQFWWTAYKTRRSARRLELLRSAADASPQALSALDGVEDATAPLPSRRLRLAMVAVLLVAVAVVIVVFQRDRRTPECRTADAVVGFIHANPDMLDAQLIEPGGPALDKYQDWSGRLQAYARQAPAGDLAPHLRRIGELSAQAVAAVSEARQDPGSRSPGEMVDRKLRYRNVIDELIEEDTALIPICHPRR